MRRENSIVRQISVLIVVNGEFSSISTDIFVAIVFSRLNIAYDTMADRFGPICEIVGNEPSSFVTDDSRLRPPHAGMPIFFFDLLIFD